MIKNYNYKCYKLDTLSIFNFDISGKDDKDLQSLNKYFIFVTLSIFHFDISGKDDKEKQPLNKSPFHFILYVFQFNISGKDVNIHNN